MTSSLELCECCYRRKGVWYIVDQNAEMTLCGPCVKQLRSESTVEKFTP